MIALLASYVLVVFILVPGVLFKLSFSLWIRPRRFQRTRTEEITYAVVIALIPLVATGLIVWNLDWPGKHPFPFEDSVAQKHTDYKLVFQAAYSERFFDDNRDAVWQAAGRVSLRQRRFLFWFYILTVIEACTVGTLSRYYGRMRHMPLIGRPYAWFADKLLLPHVSEWHILFTPFLFRPGERRIVKVDVLTTGDQLYGGTIGDHFIDTSGELTAIFLKDAQRFDRRTYLQDKIVGTYRRQAHTGSRFLVQIFVFSRKRSST